MNHADIIVIGAGIAGASVAAHLAETHRVSCSSAKIVPAITRPAAPRRCSRRSTATPSIRALTRASRKFLFEPPPDSPRAADAPARVPLHRDGSAARGAAASLRALPDIAPATRPVEVRRSARALPHPARGLRGGGPARARFRRYRRARPAPGVPAPVPEARRPAGQRMHPVRRARARHGEAGPCARERSA